MRHCTFFLLSMFFMSASFSEAQAKEMHGRMGLGYNTQFASTGPLNIGIPAISLKYGLSPGVMIEVVGGINTATPAQSVMAAKFMKTLIAGNYSNIYSVLGGGLVQANSRTGFEFLGGFGCEFFIPGIENIGWSTETGLSIDNVTSNTTAFRTFAATFLQSGIHFYF